MSRRSGEATVRDSKVSQSSLKAFPQVPAPVKVALSDERSALLVLDATERALERESFKRSVLVIKRLIDKARRSGVPIIYTITMRLGVNVVQELRPDDSRDILLETYGADKFFRTGLDDILFTKSIKYLIIVGTAANGAVLYTAFEAIMRGYTVIVVTDCISADNDEIYRFTLWQLLNSPGRTNPANKPLAPFAVTLTRERNLSFR